MQRNFEQYPEGRQRRGENRCLKREIGRAKEQVESDRRQPGKQQCQHTDRRPRRGARHPQQGEQAIADQQGERRCVEPRHDRGDPFSQRHRRQQRSEGGHEARNHHPRLARAPAGKGVHGQRRSRQHEIFGAEPQERKPAIGQARGAKGGEPRIRADQDLEKAGHGLQPRHAIDRQQDEQRRSRHHRHRDRHPDHVEPLEAFQRCRATHPVERPGVDRRRLGAIAVETRQGRRLPPAGLRGRQRAGAGRMQHDGLPAGETQHRRSRQIGDVRAHSPRPDGQRRARRRHPVRLGRLDRAHAKDDQGVDAPEQQLHAEDDDHRTPPTGRPPHRRHGCSNPLRKARTIASPRLLTRSLR